MKLYGYFRSSAAYRVRIALNLKGLQAEQASIHLQRGEQRLSGYLELQRQGLVPALIDGDAVLGQSLAILEYLEERYPDVPLLPEDPVARARVRQIALLVACDIHPLNNLRVLDYLDSHFGLGAAERGRWYQHWIAHGFTALEAMLADNPATGLFCHGERPTLADVCLVPQVYNARRFDCDLDPFPIIRSITEACEKLPAFAEAAPERQPDAE